VPVYAERGRHGGFALLPGFRTELTGLNHDEAVALLVAGSRRGAFGLGPALSSAMLKVADALPAGTSGAAQRLLVEPETDLLARRLDADELSGPVVAEVRRAVVAGHKLRIHYAAVDQGARWRTVDPVGLVTVRGQGYLLATRSGADRTYRLSRIEAAEVLDEPADRPDRVDLDQAWRDRSTRFRSGGDTVTVELLIDPARRAELMETALGVRAEQSTPDGRLHLEATFQDTRHARWALWQLATDAEIRTPWLRAALHDRATALAAATSPHPDRNDGPDDRLRPA
jgi:predicted DNA-binding transcriptional regulator YafY